MSERDFARKEDAVNFLKMCYSRIKQARGVLDERLRKTPEVYEWSFVDGPTSQGTGFYNYHLDAMWTSIGNAGRSEYVHRSDLAHFDSGMQGFFSNHRQIESLFTQLRGARASDAPDEEVKAITSRLWSFINVRCFEPLGDPRAPNFRGLWRTSYGYYMNLEQHGGKITGTFWDESGEHWGTIEGRVEGSNIQGEMRSAQRVNQDPSLPPIYREEVDAFSFTIRDDEYQFAGELRGGEGERDPGHAQRITGLNPGRIKVVKDEFLRSKWKGETYESILHGWAKDITELPREIFGTEDGGPIFQPSKTASDIYEAAKEGVKKLPGKLLEKGVEKLGDKVKDKAGLDDPVFRDDDPERYERIMEGLDRSSEYVEAAGDQIILRLYNVLGGGDLDDPEEFLMDARRTMERKVRELEDVPPVYNVDEEGDEEIELDFSPKLRLRSYKFEDVGDWDQTAGEVAYITDRTIDTYGLDAIKRVGLKMEATFPRGQTLSIEGGLENPGNLIYPRDAGFDPYKVYCKVEAKFPRWGGLKLTLRGEYGEEEMAISGQGGWEWGYEGPLYPQEFAEEE